MTLPEPTLAWRRSVCCTEGFGYTTDDSTLSGTASRFTNGGPEYAAFTISNAEIVYSSTPTAANQCVAYKIAVAAGTYSTPVIFTAVATF